jgi:hypothetical protein
MQDVLKCSDHEIFQQAQEKMHPNLNQAFLEAGTPAEAGLSAGQVGGSPDSIIATFSSNGQARLHKVIRSLSGDDCISQPPSLMGRPKGSLYNQWR